MAYSGGYRVSRLQPNSVDHDAMKRNGFHDQGILIVSIDDDRIGWDERQILINIGEKLFGKRAGKRK